LTGPIDIELNGLHYEVRETSPGIWAIWYHSHIIQYLSVMEKELMLAAYKRGLMDLQ
jgi:hypothetical protein